MPKTPTRPPQPQAFIDRYAEIHGWHVPMFSVTLSPIEVQALADGVVPTRLMQDCKAGLADVGDVVAYVKADLRATVADDPAFAQELVELLKA